MDFFSASHYGYQHGKIRQHERQISRTERDVDRAKDRTRDLDARVDRLALASQAMWELVQERTGLDDDDLLAKIREVDLRDGQLDGRARPAPRACNACGRQNNARRSACLYCGDPLDPSTAF